MTIITLDNSRSKIESALLLQIQLFNRTAAELANRHDLFQLIHQVSVLFFRCKECLTNILCFCYATNGECLGHLSLIHAPCREADSHVIKHAHLARNLLTGMIVDGIHSNLIAFVAPKAHGLGREAIEGIQSCIQLRNSSTIRINVQELNALNGILVGQNRDQHRNKGIKAAHLARI